MQSRVEWLSDEEGSICFYDNDKLFLRAQMFIAGEEAEFRLQDIVVPEKEAKYDNMYKEITSKVISCISETFRILWKKGCDETTLVEQEGSKIAQMLDSTEVVSVAYSEYMMKGSFASQKSTGCGLASLTMTKNGDGYSCENEEKTFFCRLLRYETEQPEEACYYLYEVEVSKTERNKGVATACLTELFRRLSLQSAVTIYLQVGSYNEPAVHLYKKLGFEISEALRYYTMAE